MKNKILNIICIGLVVGCVGCDDFLDRAPDLNLDEDKTFHNYETAYQYQADIYFNLRKGFNVLGSFQPAPIACATDEAEASSGWHTSNNLNVGAYDGVDNVLSQDYAGIRKCNVFLTKVNIIPFPDTDTKNHMTGEVYFLRAFFFHDIIKRYGGMPDLNDKLLFPNDDMNLPRNSYKDCVTAILSDLEKAIPLLPSTVDDNQIGRVTKGAAMALKARVLLYAASPLWDGEFTNADKWKQAADAAMDVITLTAGGGRVYSLYNTGSGVNDYEQQFFVRPPQNTEVIFWFNDEGKKFDSDEIKVWSPSGENYMGNGAVWPTQNFVDMFEMEDGLPVNESPLYDPANPYLRRDPRFYKIIIYNGAMWQSFAAETFIGGKQRLKSTDCLTGYYVRKYLPESVTYNASTGSYHNWQYIRLAEVFLNYAEAINEAEGPDKAYPYVNAIRARSGMPDLPEGLTKPQMREHIKHERAIELSFEEHRWWDVRRWLDGEKYFSGTVSGMDITKNGDGSFSYNRVNIETRIFTSKMNLYPIPTTELDKNTMYVQNPGW